MESLDYAVLLIYFGILVYIGWQTSRQQKDVVQYFVGGRKSSTFSIMTLWMTSWVGGATILGTAGQSYEKGIAGIWYASAVGIGCIVFALTFVEKVKAEGDKAGHLTYPDFIEAHYGVPCRTVSTIISIFANIGYAAGQLLATAVIMNQLTGWSLGICFSATTIITVAYTAAGGFAAMDKTCRFQAILILLGLAGIGLPLTWYNIGSIENLTQGLPAGFLDLEGMPFWSLAAMLLSLIMTFYTSSDTYIRCFSAKSVSAAKNGTILAGFLVFFIGISVCFMGLGARVLFPDLENGTNAFITIIMNLFPTGFKGLMLVVLLSAIMSTACACVLTASANITHDIYQRFFNPNISDKKVVYLSMLSSFAVGIVSAFLAWHLQDILGLMAVAFTINSAGLFLPTIAAYTWKRGTPAAAFWSVTMSLITVFTWYGGKIFFPGIAVFSMDPLWPALLVSSVLFFSLSIMSNPKT